MTPAPRRERTRRRVQIALDGVETVVALTPSEEQRLRLRLAPFVAAARRPAGEASGGLPEAMRSARLRALLRLPDEGAEDVEFSDELRRLVDKAADVYSRSLGEVTAATYRRRWVQFSGWCKLHGLEPLPAPPETVMLYLADLIGREPPPALNTLRGRVAAINKVHVESDHRPPGDDPALRLMMRGLSRTVARAPAREATGALRIADLRDLLRAMDQPDPMLVRDSALLHLHAAGIGPGNLSRLTWDDVTLLDDHARLDLRPAYHRTADTTVRLERRPDAAACPVGALSRWRDIAGTTPSQVFSAVDRQGRRHGRQMSSSHLKRVIDTRVDCLVTCRGDDAVAVAARLLDRTPNDVLRDRAMLLLGWAGAFRRGEVTRLVWADLRVVNEGLLVRLRQSKTDRHHQGVDVGVPLGRSLLTCPVRAVLAWKQRMQQQLGDGFTDTTPCWPAVGQAGRIDSASPITPEGLTRVITRRAVAAGVDGHFGGRSLRAGFISTAADLDLPMELIAAQSRHTSMDNLLRYIRNDDVFRRNAAERVGL